MNIDESIWGAKDTWRNAVVTTVQDDEYDEDSQRLKAYELAKVKVSTENLTVDEALNNNALSKSVNFDPSVSFWSVGYQAEFLRMGITGAISPYEEPNLNQFLSSGVDFTRTTVTGVPLFVNCRIIEDTNDSLPIPNDYIDFNGYNFTSFKQQPTYSDDIVTNFFIPNILDTWCERPEYAVGDKINQVEPAVNNYERIVPAMDFDYSRVICKPTLFCGGWNGSGGVGGLNLESASDLLLQLRVQASNTHEDCGSIRNIKGISRLTASLVCTKTHEDYATCDTGLSVNMIQDAVFYKSMEAPTNVEDENSVKMIYQFDKQDAVDYGEIYGQHIIPMTTTAYNHNEFLLGGSWFSDDNRWSNEGGYFHYTEYDDMPYIYYSSLYRRYPADLMNISDYMDSDGSFNDPSYFLTDIDPFISNTYKVDETTLDKHWKHLIYEDENNYFHFISYLDLNSFDLNNELSDLELCQAIIDYVCEQTAYLGFLFTLTVTGLNQFRTLPTASMPTDWYCPKFDFTNGAVTTGEYTHNPEADITHYPNALWSNNLRDTIPAPTPPEPPEPDPSEDSGDLDSTITHSTVTSSVKYFKLGSADLINLSNKLNGGYVISGGNTLAEQLETDFKGTNPYEYINSVVWFPFEVNATAFNANIVMGAYDTEINKNIVEVNNSTAVLDFGTHVVKRQFRDFRDFAPYTKLQLDVPFCGKIELDTKVFMGHTLGVKLFYDVTNGACTALIYRDNLIYQTLDGRCGVQIPMTAVNMAQYQNQIAQLENAVKQNQLSKDYSVTQGALNYFGSWAKLGASLGSGVMFNSGSHELVDSRFFSQPVTVQDRWTSYNPNLNNVGASSGGILSSMNNLAYQKDAHDYKSEILDYSMSHTAPTASAIGSSDPINNLVCDYRCRLLYVRCKLLDNYIHDGAEDFSIYKSTIGFATIKSNTIGENRGFTIATNVRLDGVPATTREKDLINSALLNGIIINIADNDNT